MAAHRVSAGFSQAALDDESQVLGLGSSRPSLFPHGLRREERLTSRLIATLELIRPFAQRFFEHLPSGRRPTRATKNVGSYRAWGLLEPRLGDSNHRADAAFALRNATFPVWRCAFEVKYLNEGSNSKHSAARFSAAQVERTYMAAHNLGFNHVLTISADQPQDGTNPSGFHPSQEHLDATGLSHHSWLKVLWLIRQTRLEDAAVLSAAEDRILADFEHYLQGSNIWKFSRKVSLGIHGFATVRRFCNAPVHTTPDEIQPIIADVATRWVQLSDSIAQRLSIETDHLVRGAGNRTVASTMKTLQRTKKLSATFVTESPADGSVSVEVDIPASRVVAVWHADVAELVATRNPQAKTRWRAISNRLESWPSTAYKGRVVVLGEGASVLVGPCSIDHAVSAIQTLPRGLTPQRIRIERATPASQTRVLRGDTIATIVERAALGMAPWKG